MESGEHPTVNRRPPQNVAVDISGRRADAAQHQSYMAAERQKDQDRQAMRDEMVRMIKMYIPPWLLNADKRAPGFLAGSETGKPGFDPDSFYLGFIADHCAWKQFRGGSAMDMTTEWSQTVDGESIVVVAGYVMWGGTTLTNNDTDWGDVFYVDVSGMSGGTSRWLYLKIDLSAQTTLLAFSTDANPPVDDPQNLIVNWRLSKWSFAKPGTVVIPTKTKTAWAGGGIHIPAVFGPP